MCVLSVWDKMVKDKNDLYEFPMRVEKWCREGSMEIQV